MQPDQPGPPSLRKVQLAAVREILRATAAALPLREILPIITNVTIIAFDALTAWLMLVEDGRLHTVVARGEAVEALEKTACTLGIGAAGLAAVGDQPVILPPGTSDPADPVVGPLSGQQAPIVLLPITAAGQVQGLLGAVVPPLAAQDITFLVTLAEQAAIVIEGARLRKEARTWHQRLDAVVEQMSEPVLVYDSIGTLVLLNTVAEAWLGDKGVRVGDAIADVIRKTGMRDAHDRPIPLAQSVGARALRGEAEENIELSMPLPDGAARYLLASAVPLRNHGIIDGAVVVWRDITERKQAEAERERLLVREQTAHAAAQDAVRVRDTFLAVAAHELKTPVTTLLGNAELLLRRVARDDTVSERIKKPIAVIGEQAERLNKLITALLDISRIEAGQLSIERKPLDLCALVRRVVDEVLPLVERHTIDLICPDTPLLVEGDELRLDQVLQNLIENAMKYSPQGTSVAVRVEQRGDRVCVSVTDQGMGIPAVAITDLFRRFYRADNIDQRRITGMGIGLFVVKEIVTLHNGTVTVESMEGKGSTFVVCLPISRDN